MGRSSPHKQNVRRAHQSGEIQHSISGVKVWALPEPALSHRPAEPSKEPFDVLKGESPPAVRRPEDLACGHDLLPPIRGLDEVEVGQYGMELGLVPGAKESRSSRGACTEFLILCRSARKRLQSLVVSIAFSSEESMIWVGWPGYFNDS
jgi:hypothetical protein